MDKYELTEKVDILTKKFLKGKIEKDTDTFIFHENQIKEIANGTFDSYKQINEIYYYGSLKDFISIKGKDNFLRHYTVHLFLEDKEEETKYIEIPSDIEEIGEYCFYNCREIYTIKFLNDNAKIGKYAFSNCDNLTHVSLPKNIEIIEEGTFYMCEGIEHIYVPSNIRVIKKWAFAECSSLESFIIPDSLEILEAAFYGCTSLHEIDLKGNITSLLKGTFVECLTLTRVVIRDNITSIEPGTFKDPHFRDLNEIEIYYYGSMHNWLYFSNKKVFEEVSSVHLFLDGSLKETTSINYTGPLKVPNYAFTNCINLKYVNLNEGVTSIGKRAFADCVNLEILVLPNTIEKFGEDGFDWCLSLKILFMGDESEIKEVFESFGYGAGDFSELNIYSYKEDKPRKEGKYWHYVDDVPTIYD